LADQRITQLTPLSKAGAAANDAVPIADISASETKRITLKDLVAAGIDLVDAGEIDLAKLDQGSATKLGAGAISDGVLTAAKMAADAATAVAVTAPSTGNHRGRGWLHSGTGNLQVWDGAAFQQVVMPTAGIGDLQVTAGKLADGAVTTAKVSPLGSAAYAAGSVNTAALADLNVTSGKLADGAVLADKIGTGAVETAKLAAGAVTYDRIQNLSTTDRLLGRSSAGAGPVEEIALTAAGRALIAGVDTAAQRSTLGLGTLATASGTWADGSTFSGTSSGTNTGDQTITLTGDVTGTGTGTFAATIADGAITELKYAALSIPTGAVQDDAITAAKLADQSAAVVSNASPSAAGAFVGQQWLNTSTAVEFTWTGADWLRQASLSTITFTDSTPLAFAVAYPDPYSATITATMDTQQAGAILAGPGSGADAAPTFRALLPSDLPIATSVALGASSPGTGLAITAAGVLNHSNSVTGATVSGITFDAQGHISAAVPLVPNDIPDLNASKITEGTLSTARLADDAVTGAKLANYSVGKLGEAVPTADYISQLYFNPLDKAFFMWDGNVWQPIGVSAGVIKFAGTYDAAGNEVASTTAEGATLGLTVGSALPTASATNSGYYLVVSESGTGVSPAPAVALAPPDLLLSTGSAWVEVDTSAGYTAQTAAQVSFSPAGAIAAATVQAAIEEVSSECRNADNISSGTLAVARGGTGLASYTKGDLVAASGSTTLAKLAVGTNGQALVADSATTTGLKWANVGSGTVTAVSSSTAALTVATGTTTPALTLRSATTSVDGIVQLSDSISTTSSALAATSTAVKTAYDLAAAALPKAGGTVTGQVLIGTTGSLVFEGSVDDGFELALAVANPTADRTLTFPDETGTLLSTGSVGVVNNAMVASDAAIALSKLATGALPAGITVASANIVNGTITNDDINASAAIALSKLATGALPTAITIASANIVDGTITNDDINASAAIALSKLGSGGTITCDITGNAATVTNGVYTNGAQTIGGAKTFANALVSDGTFTANGTVFSSGIRTNTTTGVSANVFLNTANDQVQRVTSSRKYKIEIETAPLAESRRILSATRPVSYLPNPENTSDDPTIRVWGLIAEEVAEYAPEMVMWGVGGQAEGVSYDRFGVHLINVANDHEARIAALEAALLASIG
jgi:hypothetical protein